MILCFFTIFMGVLGCAQNAEIVVRIDEREVLTNRIREYWQHQINGYVDRAYLYEYPEFREKVSLLEYLNRFKLVRYREAEILDVVINGGEAESQVKLTYAMLLTKAPRSMGAAVQKKLTNMTKFDKATWFKKDGHWYHIPEGFEIAKK
jgi:hypothetical protein